MFDTKIIIFHGYESNHTKDKYQYLPFPSEGITVDYNQPFDQTYNQFKELIEKNIDQKYNLIFLGHSLGGWWARHFAKIYHKPCLLLNPVAHIETVKLSIPNIERYKELQFKFDSYPPAEITYYIETADDLIDFDWNGMNQEGEVNMVNNGNHRIQYPEKFYEILKRMDKQIIL